MTPHDLIAGFEVVAEAPDGVVRLRELILQLAVRGKLVPQDPVDEPANVLLERIDAEKARLVRTQRIHKPADLPDLPDEYAFALPASWTWTHVARLVPWDLTDGDWVESKDQDPGGGVRLTQLADVGVGTFLDKSDRFLTKEKADRLRCTFLERGDVLIARLPRPLGRACIFPGLSQPAVTVVDVAIARCEGTSVAASFLVDLMNSPLVGAQAEALAAGTTRKRISTGNLRRIVVPLPPLAEQHRIVARVDELMGLLDRLEAARTARDATRAAVRDSTLDALREADAADEVEVAWNRFVERMDDLVCDPADIAPLRQAVLQLAVRGRLVPQDPADEPASELLKRIAADRAGTVSAKLTRMGDDPGGYEEEDTLPVGWEWVPLQDVVQFIDYRGKTPQKTANGVRLITARNIRDGYVTEEPREFVSPKTYEGWMTRGFPKKGDVLFTTEAPMGKAALVAFSERFALAQRAICLHPYADLDSKYLMWMLLSPWFQERLLKRATGMTATGIKGAKLRLIRVPIPAVDEQRRIAARVDELMDLLDRLEERLAAARAVHAAFAAAAVHHFDA